MLKNYRPIEIHTLAYNGPLVHIVEGAIATETVHVTETDYFGTATITDTYVPYGSTFPNNNHLGSFSGMEPVKSHPPMPMHPPPMHPPPMHHPPMPPKKPMPMLDKPPIKRPFPTLDSESLKSKPLPVLDSPPSTAPWGVSMPTVSMPHTSVVTDIISVIGGAPDFAVRSFLRPLNRALVSALQDFPRIFKDMVDNEYADADSKAVPSFSTKALPTASSSNEFPDVASKAVSGFSSRAPPTPSSSNEFADVASKPLSGFSSKAPPAPSSSSR